MRCAAIKSVMVYAEIMDNALKHIVEIYRLEGIEENHGMMTFLADMSEKNSLLITTIAVQACCRRDHAEQNPDALMRGTERVGESRESSESAGLCEESGLLVAAYIIFFADGIEKNLSFGDPK